MCLPPRRPTGGRVQDEAPGTHVLVDGLNHDVMDDDIKELFAGVGELKSCGVCIVFGVVPRDRTL